MGMFPTFSWGTHGDTHGTLDLKITDTALFRVGAEDVIVFVDKTVELVLQVFDIGAHVGDLELKICGVDGHNF